ncbi:MAG: hypothetical protein MK134_03055 [Dehalococcoidia bacterium]|nr:hypothetical protein [Dehalococcoidia bacterium]
MSAPDSGEPILELTDAPTANFLRSGPIAGLVSALIFTIVHQIFISDIWFSIPIMLIAGALCGPSLGWSYGVLVSVPTLKNWLAYNLVYMAMFGILGAVSVAAFDPITTVEALIEVNESPNELIGKAMPLTVVFTFLMAGIVTVLSTRRWANFGSALLACVVLVLSLGLNVSIIGLVSLPSGSLYLVVELFALILALGVVFAVAFAILERKQLSPR